MSLLSFFGFNNSQELAAYGPGEDFWYQPVGRSTTAGVRVDEAIALNYSVCWAATRLLAGTGGWLPFNLYKRMAGGGANIDAKHRVHRLIHSQPNQDMAAMMFRARSINHQVNWGNTFSEIRRTNGGQPFSLEPIHPWRIPPQNIRREDDGKIVYLVYRPSGVGQPQRVKQEDMFHVPSIISDDGIIGKGVVTAAREAIGKAMGTQQHGASSLKSGGAPPLALKGAKFKTREDREEYRRQLKEVHSGPDNAGNWLLLPPDAEVQMLGFNLRDSQFIESQQFDIEEISRWYGVPPHLVGHLLRATFNNIEELGISFVKYSLIQWLKLWEQEVWRKLLTPDEQDTHYAKFVVDALERGNLATRTEAGVKKFFNGLWTLNQWAEQEDMNPIKETVTIDGKEVSLGEMHFVQQAMIPLSMAAKGEGLKADQKEPEQKEQPEANKPEVEEAADEDERLAAVRTDVATLSASTATLSLSVERIVSAVGTLQSEQASGKQAIDDLARLVQSQHEAQAATGAELAAKLDQALATTATLSAAQESMATATAEMQKTLAAAFVKDVLARLMSVELHNIKNIAQQASKFDARLAAFYDKHRRTMEVSLASPLAAAAAAHGLNGTADRLRQYIDGHIDESTRQLLSVCDCTAEELPARVEACVAKWHEDRTFVPLGDTQ